MTFIMVLSSLALRQRLNSGTNSSTSCPGHRHQDKAGGEAAGKSCVAHASGPALCERDFVTVLCCVSGAHGPDTAVRVMSDRDTILAVLGHVPYMPQIKWYFSELTQWPCGCTCRLCPVNSEQAVRHIRPSIRPPTRPIAGPHRDRPGYRTQAARHDVTEGYVVCASVAATQWPPHDDPTATRPIRYRFFKILQQLRVVGAGRFQVRRHAAWVATRGAA